MTAASEPLQVHRVSSPQPGGGIPASRSRFIGRASEVESMRRLLANERALTLSGTGGCGKPRLALAIVRRTVGRAGGQTRWVELAGLQSPRGSPRTLGRVQEWSTEPDDHRRRGLFTAMRERNGMLVLGDDPKLEGRLVAASEPGGRASPMMRDT